MKRQIFTHTMILLVGFLGYFAYTSQSIAEPNQLQPTTSLKDRTILEINCSGLGATQYFGDVNIEGVLFKISDDSPYYEGTLYLDAYSDAIRLYNDNIKFKAWVDTWIVHLIPIEERWGIESGALNIFDDNRPSAIKLEDGYLMLSKCSLK